MNDPVTVRERNGRALRTVLVWVAIGTLVAIAIAAPGMILEAVFRTTRDEPRCARSCADAQLSFARLLPGKGRDLCFCRTPEGGEVVATVREPVEGGACADRATRAGSTLLVYALVFGVVGLVVRRQVARRKTDQEATR